MTESVRGDLAVTERAELSDAALVEATREGDQSAFGELWRRHYPSAVAAARATTTKFDADDLAQESFVAILNAIKRGGGPTSGFRAYLLTAVRNTAAGWGRSSREFADDELDAHVDPDWDPAETEQELDRSLTATAFRSLPTRWQEVLWYTEIEQMKPAAIAPLLGMKPVAVAQLAFRAREGLREAWIQAHLRSLSDDSECKWVVERLGTYARKNSSKRDATRIDAHLLECPRCVIVLDEAGHVSSRLALVMLPLALGVVGAGGYLASVQGVPVSGAVAAGADGVFADAGVNSSSGGASSASSAGHAVHAMGMGAKIALSAAAVTVAVAIAGGITVAALSRPNTPAQARPEAVAEVDETREVIPEPEPIVEPEELVEPPAVEPPVAEPPVAEPPVAAPEVESPVQSAPAAPVAPTPAPVPTPQPEPTPTPTPSPTPTPTPTPTPSDPPVEVPPADFPTVAGWSAFVDGLGQVNIDIVVPIPEGQQLRIGLAGDTPQLVSPGPDGTALVTLMSTTEQLDAAAEVVFSYVNEFGAGPELGIPLNIFDPRSFS